ncbi:MAG: hypothetical protein CMF50_04835 [Legionellales bacterium]|nr:hypothetical protein [Legionellales bacterium]|tara:strand:+ start:9843 stop:10931 length:1089 start_codon:yes stop_codon:yes gene_type:complete
MTNDTDILFEEHKGSGGNVGLITLNRPEQLNALSFEMICAIDDNLAQWEINKDIKAVIIRGAGDKAFCAGGDIRAIYDQGQTEGVSVARRFFWNEYRMNHRIKHFSKPYISLLDGITMGGGVGASVHGSHCIATERLLFAMPETSIGFFPDVGGSYFLSRCHDELGVYLGLTGARMNAADAMEAGFATHFVSSNRQDDIIQQIIDTNLHDDAKVAVSELLVDHAVQPENTELLIHNSEIETCFSADTMEEIMLRLAEQDTPWSRKTTELLQQKSPTSLKITLKQLRKGVGLGFEECLQQEYRMVQRVLQSHDLYEGIRSVIIDKDHNPQWSPDTLAAVTETMVDDYFAPLADGELHFDEDNE